MHASSREILIEKGIGDDDRHIGKEHWVIRTLSAHIQTRAAHSSDNWLEKHLTVDFCPAVCPGADLNNLPSLDSRKIFCGMKRGFSLKLRRGKMCFYREVFTHLLILNKINRFSGS